MKFKVDEISSVITEEIKNYRAEIDVAEVGRVLEAGETFGEIESVKAVADLSTPLAGEVVEVNSIIEDHLEVLSEDPWGRGWLINIKLASKEMGHLLDAAGYEELLAAKS